MQRMHWKPWTDACWTAGSFAFKWPATVDRQVHKHDAMAATEAVADVIVDEGRLAIVDLVVHEADPVAVAAAEVEEVAAAVVVADVDPFLVHDPVRRVNHRVAVRSVR